MSTVLDLLPENEHGFISGGGQLGILIRSFNWAETSLGSVHNWPQSLRSALSICLNSNFPIAIYWGKDLHLLYNDAWSSIPGNKHPWALGRTAREVWPDIWDQIESQFALAFTGQPGGSKDALLPMQRHGFTEECYFDFTFTPIYGEAGTVEGIFNAVIETTYRVINERRTTLLKQLAIQLASASTTGEVYRKAIRFIRDFSKDIPFAFLYTLEETDQPRLFAATELPSEPADKINQSLPFADCLQAGQSILLENLRQYMSEIPSGFWPERPHAGMLTPLKSSQGNVNGFLFCGLSARLGYDEDYRIFIESIANAIATVVQNIASLEEERKRAEALAEIDRLKTTFFTNISHEFRTPLTLLLGPLEEMLGVPQVDPSLRTQLEMAHRNALRMQKLVNTLLDFSKIEAGRVEAIYRPVDIGTFTAELASTFRSAIEKAGMELQIHRQPVSSVVYLDPDMWEKIVLNLVSNAFKYTYEGRITVSIQPVGDQVEVSVADTGVGIPDDQLDKLFNRFHQIDNTLGRSQEGTGIGLALVKELVKLHQGTIQIASLPGKGSVFTIRLPTGSHHLPPDKLGPAVAFTPSRQSVAHLEEALHWIGEDAPVSLESGLQAASSADGPAPDKTHTILVADDNADMRAYVQRLFSDLFVVIPAVDGQDAFAKILRFRPDLVLTDVMMPRLDGFGLLQKIRNHSELKATPVIFLSARAGEEAKVEGLDAGADDYLVKPFSARELMVRVTNHIRINQIRRQTEQQFYQMFLQAPAIINVFTGPTHTYEFFHPKNKEIFGEVDFTGMRLKDALPELENQGIFELLDEVYRTGKTIEQRERKVAFFNKTGLREERFLNFIYQPWLGINGSIQGVLNFAIDVTEQVLARKKIEAAEEKARLAIESAELGTYEINLLTDELTSSDRFNEIWGIPPTAFSASLESLIHPDDRPVRKKPIRN